MKKLLQALRWLLLVALVLLVAWVALRVGIRRKRGLEIDRTATVVEQVRRIGELSSAGF